MNFQHHYSCLQCHRSDTVSSEIILICWFSAQETFLIIINVENNCAAWYFLGNAENASSGIDEKENEHEQKEKSKNEPHLFEIKIVCKIINVCSVTFDQCNASLQNKIINFFQKQ